jgi:hypothetical protein
MDRGWLVDATTAHQPAQGTSRPLRIGIKKNGALTPLAID